MDVYVKIVLTVIAACLLLQVAQGFGRPGAPGSGQVESSSPETTAHYLVQPIPRARLLLRVDSVTGRTWTMPLQPQGAKFWTQIGEAPPEPVVGDEGEGAPSPPDEAAK